MADFEHPALTQVWAVKEMWVCWKPQKRLWVRDQDAAVGKAMIQSRGAQREAEDVRSTKVEATRKMRVVAVGSTLETRAGSEDENVNPAAVIVAAVCVGCCNWDPSRLLRAGSSVEGCPGSVKEAACRFRLRERI